MAPQPICASLAVCAAVTVAAISVVLLRTKWKGMTSKLRELEKSLALSVENCNSERQGRIRAQQALRKEMLQVKSDKNVETTSFPMTPIGIVQSCFSTRNGTPRQPLLVPLARACLVFDPARVPMACLEDPSRSKMKAKVKVPRLVGGKMGVLATRSPHRPIPIGLTVAKIEAVKGHMVLLSGIDLVDGTPVLDIKPYLPYSDSIENATVPDWIMEEDLLAVPSVGFSKGFSSALANCWESLENNTLYASSDEFRDLIQQILSWDIRSSSQRTRPHKYANGALDSRDVVVYHLTVESLNISYTIDAQGNVVVEGVSVDPAATKSKQRLCNYMMWNDKLR